MLLILNLPLFGIWIRLLTISYRLLYPAILAFCCVGAYSEVSAPFTVFLAAGAGVAGYVFRLLGCSPAPLILGLVFGPMLEQNVRRSMQLSRGDPLVFVERPISLGILMLALVMVLAITGSLIRQTRRGAVAS